MTTVGWHNYVLGWADKTPDAPALVGPDETLTYRQLAWRGRKFAAALQQAGVTRGQVVMVRTRRDFDYQLTLALSMLGAIAVSNTAKQFLDFEPQTDWLLTRQAVAEYPSAKQILVNEPWVQRAFNNVAPFEIIGLENEDSIERICLTSGTTGRPKAVALTHRIQESRQKALEGALDSGGVELYLMDMGTAVGALRAVAAAETGLPYLHLGDRSAESVLKLFSRVKIERLAGSPIQVHELLKFLEAKNVDLSALNSVRAAGSRLPEPLIRLVSELTGRAIQTGYGSTEAGPSTYRVSVTQSDGLVGAPMAGVEIQAVDERGLPLPIEESGLIRCRTPYGVSTYLDEEPATAAQFEGEWFYPGDFGRVLANGELEILGRVDDLINLGGVKLSPLDIEMAASELVGFEEVCAFGFLNSMGQTRLGLAFTSKTKPSVKELRRVLKKQLRLDVEPELLQLTELPRNEAGKVLRAQLAELARNRFA